jgi:hypothetical protein
VSSNMLVVAAGGLHTDQCRAWWKPAECECSRRNRQSVNQHFSSSLRPTSCNRSVSRVNKPLGPARRHETTRRRLGRQDLDGIKTCTRQCQVATGTNRTNNRYTYMLQAGSSFLLAPPKELPSPKVGIFLLHIAASRGAC